MRSIPQILKDSHTIAVVGLSPKPDRASLAVAHYLQEHGYRIVPVNPRYAGQDILGEKVYPDLHAAAAREVIDKVAACLEGGPMAVVTAERLATMT